MGISYDDMFKSLNISLILSGLENIHLAKSPRPRWFQNVQWFFFVYGYVNLIPAVIFEILYAVLEDRSDFTRWILKVSELITCVIVSSLCLLKTAVIIMKRKSIIEQVEELRHMWPTEEDDPEVYKIAQEYMTPTKKFSFIYTILSNSLSFIYNLCPLMDMLFIYITENRVTYLMPYYIWIAYDYTQSGMIYFLTYLFEFYAGVFTTSGMTAFDTIFVVLIAMLSMHFTVLSHKIKKMSENYSKMSKIEIAQKLQQLIDEHNHLIHIVSKVEKVFSFVLLVNLLGSSLLLCSLIFSISISPIGLVGKYVVVICSTLIQIIMMTWYGDMLLEKSAEISEAAYHSDWVDIDDIDHKKSLIMLQVRAQKPVGISAMGFTVLSLTSFTSILSASWSYFTLIRTVYMNKT